MQKQNIFGATIKKKKKKKFSMHVSFKNSFVLAACTLKLRGINDNYLWKLREWSTIFVTDPFISVVICRLDFPCFLTIPLREKYPNTQFFLVLIQSECGKIRTRKNSVSGHFSRSVHSSRFTVHCMGNFLSVRSVEY